MMSQPALGDDVAICCGPALGLDGGKAPKTKGHAPSKKKENAAPNAKSPSTGCDVRWPRGQCGLGYVVFSNSLIDVSTRLLEAGVSSPRKWVGGLFFWWAACPTHPSLSLAAHTV